MVKGVAQTTPYSASRLGATFPDRACAKFFQAARADCQKLNKENSIFHLTFGAEPAIL